MSHIITHNERVDENQDTVFTTEGLARHAHWVPRLILAGVFIYHGLSKFAGLEGFATMMGLPFTMALLVACAEVSGGVGAIAGGFLKDRLGDIVTRLSGLAIIPVMLGAITMVHWGQWNFMATESHPMGGMEFQVTLLLVALFLVLRGNRL